MNLPRSMGPAALVFALGAMPSSEATAQAVKFATFPDQIVVDKLYYPAKAKQAGSCGAHMYWKKGKCVDARDKK